MIDDTEIDIAAYLAAIEEVRKIEEENGIISNLKIEEDDSLINAH